MRSFPLFVGVVLTCASAAKAVVTLPDLFSDHAVLQASDSTPVWGKANPGEKITVALGETQAVVIAHSDGKWLAHLNLKNSRPGPFTLIVHGENHLTVSDVMVGQVWLCSGQSNMAFPLSKAIGGKEEVAGPSNLMLRQFQVESKSSPFPLAEARGKWTVATSQTSGSFTAVGYYFGKRLQQELNTPVGLLHASWGGSCIEAWMSAEGLRSNPDLKAGAENVMAAFAAHQKFSESYRQWQVQTRREDKPPVSPSRFAGPDVDESNWKTVILPGLFSRVGLPDTGAVWLRRKIVIPPTASGQSFDIFLGDPHDAVQVYWNGNKIGEGTTDNTIHRYTVGGGLVTSGEGILTIRVFSSAGEGGILAGPRFAIGMGGKDLPLSGEWRATVEYSLSAPDTAALDKFPKRPSIPQFSIPTFNLQNIATYLYNGMIHPLIPYAIAGSIWYQGEQNLGNARQYESALPLLIFDWRTKWGCDFPFLFCQLPNYGSRIPDPEKSVKSSWAEIREGQTKALALPKTGAAILIDVGEAGNVHPTDKKTPGERLAWVALAKVYGRDFFASGPTFEELRREGNKLRVCFQNAHGGLFAKRSPLSKCNSSIDSEVEGFVICGEDRRWQWANAKIEGDTVLVWADGIAEPRNVRYAWADNPLCNLFDGAGLPAAPFRTDDFSGVTDAKHYGDLQPDTH